MPDQSTFDLTGATRYPDRSALLSVLRRTAIRPAPRTGKRTTQQTELWTICRLLGALGTAEQLHYPLSAAHMDRPDFLLRDGETVIGVEITEAVPPQFSEFMTLAAREFPNAWIEPGHFGWNAPKRTMGEMRSLLSQSKLNAPDWSGDQAEEEWAAFIEGVIRNKLKKLAAPAFAKLPQNWLAIYDNTPYLMLEHEAALSHLLPRLGSVWSELPVFDAIFIDSDPVMIKVTSQGASSWRCSPSSPSAS